MEKPGKPKIYELTIDDGDAVTGIDYVAMVDDPAIERFWQSFSKEPQKQAYQITSDERHIVSGPLMMANLPIFRFNETYGEHYVVFRPAQIEKIVYKFFKNKFTSNVNLMHEPQFRVNGVFMFESFLIDSTRGLLTPAGFDKMPDGTWFGSYKIDNEEVWKAVKEGTFKGFSVEGFFNYGSQYQSDEELINRLREVINPPTNDTRGGDSHFKDEKQKYMSEKVDKIINAIKELFTEQAPGAAANAGAATFQEYKLQDGTVIKCDKDLVPGSKVTMVTAQGEKDAPDGTYYLDNGKAITIMNAVITEVSDAADIAAQKQVKEFNDLKKSLEDQVKDFNSRMTEVANAVKSFETAGTEITSLKAELKKQSEAQALLITAIEELAKLPSEDSKQGKPDNKFFNAETREKKLRGIGDLLNKAKIVK